MLSLSIIIPAYNEAPLIEDAVAAAYRIADEVIVVDGNSTDQTVQRARNAGATVVRSGKSRGQQLHTGALVARGDILLFLHADARLPVEARHAILSRLNDPAVIGGNFLIRFLPTSSFTRFLATFNDLRRMVSRRYYGDSGMFVRRQIYRQLGGYKPYPLMADYEFSRRMERAGRCVYIRNVSVYASARRFRGKELRTFLVWMSLQLLYWCKVPPRILYMAYPDIRSDQPGLFLDAYKIILRGIEDESSRGQSINVTSVRTESA